MNIKRMKIEVTALALIVAFVTLPALNAEASTVLYSNNFSQYPIGMFPSDWKTLGGSSWSVQMGLGQSKWLTYRGCSTCTGWTSAYYAGATFTDMTYSVTARGLGYCPSNPTENIRNQLPPVLTMTFRQQSTTGRLNMYFFHLDIGKAEIKKVVNGQSYVLAHQNLGRLSISGTFSISVTIVGNSITASWSGALATGATTQGTIETTDSTFPGAGYVGVATYNCDAAFTSVLVSSA